jgi:hypothetical protein
VVALQIADPSSRQRGRPTETRPQLSFRQEVISGHESHKGARYRDILTDRSTVSRKVNSTSTSTFRRRVLGLVPRAAGIRLCHPCSVVWLRVQDPGILSPPL